jgi:type VI secretion system protein VasG
VASVEYLSPTIRSGHVLLALMANEETARMLMGSSDVLRKISVETLASNLSAIVAGSREDAESGKVQAAEAAAGEALPGAVGTKALDQFTINLTERARKGEIDPVLGRDTEIRQMVDILIRRRQNNPILTGEAGRKTAAGSRIRAQDRRATSAPLQHVATMCWTNLFRPVPIKGIEFRPSRSSTR